MLRYLFHYFTYTPRTHIGIVFGILFEHLRTYLFDSPPYNNLFYRTRVKLFGLNQLTYQIVSNRQADFLTEPC